MTSDAPAAVGQFTRNEAHARVAQGSPGRGGPAEILPLAASIGLTAGFLDLGLLVLKARLIDRDFYRLGAHFGWVIPCGVLAIVLVPGALLALIACLRRRGAPLKFALGLLSFLGFLDICARLPLAVWGSLPLSAGLAVTASRLFVPRQSRFLRLARYTTAVLGGALLLIALVTLARPVWTERKALAALPPPPPLARNVLLIVWDTVRAANLSLHGYHRPTSPTLDRLAAHGVRFDHAFATAPWTLPSHGSLFTGRWPHELTADWRSPLDGAHLTLAEYLGARGYDTAGFVANLDYCGRETGLSRGFVHYEDYPLDVWDFLSRYVGIGQRIDFFSFACVVNKLLEKQRGGAAPLLPRAREHAKDGATLNRDFLAWLSWQQRRGRPFFAFLNYNDAHTPYEVADPSVPAQGSRPVLYRDRLMLRSWATLEKMHLPDQVIQLARDAYDDCIVSLDRTLAALLGELERRGVLDNTLLIITADHGEHLGDHLLFFHGCSLYRQLVEVPLVIVDPKAAVPAGRVVASQVSLRDVPATLVDLLGLGRDSPFPGQSLARHWAHGAGTWPSEPEPLLMETGKPPLLTNQGREPVARGPMKSLVARGMHYIRAGDGREELYVLDADPEERSNLAGSAAAQGALARFRDALAGMLRRR
jgi:arylsulfatase A-like enzyme